MTSQRPVDMSVWLRQQAGSGPAGYLEDILEVTRETRQRRWWSSLERWLPVDLGIRRQAAGLPFSARPLALLAILALIVALAVAVFTVGSPPPPPAPFGLARNGAVAYAQGGDILRVDPSTGSVTPLISGPEDDSAPVFSRDGTQLALVRAERAGLQSIVVARADGREPRHLIGGLVGPVSMAWSPDGTRLAVVASEAGVPSLSIVPTAGGATVKLASGLKVEDVQWRPPDGTELIFRGSSPGGEEVAIYAVSPSDGELRTLTPVVPDTGTYSGPRIALDGVTLTYSNWEPLAGTDRTDGWTHVRDLTSGADRQIRYSDQAAEVHGDFAPDGSTVLIERQRIGPDGTFPAQVVIAPVQGGGSARPIGPEFLYDTPHRFGFTPDGQQVIVTIDGVTRFYRVADGTEVGQPLTMEFPDVQRLHP